MPKKKRAFNPLGAGFDIDASRVSGAKRDARGHLPSLDPRTGRVLKGRRHESFKEAVTQNPPGYKPAVNPKTGDVHMIRGKPPKHLKSVDTDTLLRMSRTKRPRRR